MQEMTGRITAFWIMLAALAGAMAASARGGEFLALARLDPARSHIISPDGRGLEIELQLSQAVPWRVFTLDEPRRLVLDFREVDWGGAGREALLRGGAAPVKDLRLGRIVPGWSRMVVALGAPLAIESAEMKTDPTSGAARVVLRMEPVSGAAFAAAAGRPAAAGWEALPPPARVAPAIRRQDGTRPLLVVLDPGHGGIDPGAEHAGLKEADLVLVIARRLKEALLREGGFDVLLTRNDDIFVPLAERLSIARAVGADVFISLHADALPEGRARGATIYTLSRRASDAASQRLAESHDRADLLSGVDLAGQDDEIALVLMDLARRETLPRSEALAQALVEAMKGGVGGLHKRPHQSADFSVLKAADIPSVLIEFGFLSSEEDRANLASPRWQERATRAIVAALGAWARADAAQAELLRR